MKNLPADNKAELANDLNRRCRDLDFDADTMTASSVLLPKVVGAASLAKFRPIACLKTWRKLLGYLWLLTLPIIRMATYQTAFVRGAQAIMGAHSLLLAAEKAKEWGQDLFAAQIDLKKAFDHVNRDKALQALKAKGVSSHHLAWMSKMWQEHSLVMKMGGYETQRFKTTRGLPQGAPESPLIFTILIDTVLQNLDENGTELAWGSGWTSGGCRVSRMQTTSC